MKIKDIIKKHKVLTVIALIILFILIVWWVTRLPSPIFKNDYSTVITDETGSILRVYLNSDSQWILPIEEKGIPYKLKNSVLLYEDKRFYSHFGIDIFALFRAIKQDILKRKIVSGASTITMQTARTIKPKKRNIGNKIIEMIQALKLEIYFSKEEILKLYLSHISYGNNIIGYRTASLKYFGVEPENLTWSQSATLAVIPNEPGALSKKSRIAKVYKKRNFLLRKLYQSGYIDKESLELSLSEPVILKSRPFPLSAPHLSDRIYRTKKGCTIKTTLNKKIQDDINNLAKNQMDELNKVGIYNCAIIVAETQTGKIKAYIGSNNYFDRENGGRIDGVTAKNSTGSILKPFLYTLLMDEGAFIPESKVEDIPISYKGYSPYNMNQKFKGIVTMKEALTSSLNTTAVASLKEYGVENFYNFLKNSGMTTLFRESEGYGLSLILGGAEGRLDEIAAIYAALGNYGKYKPLSFIENNNIENKQIFSKGSSWLMVESLKELKRPGIEYYWENFSNQWNIAWKTGTSFGNRDAWAVGVSPKWTIGVWIGNFDDKECPALIGIEAAAPILFKVFSQLPKEKENAWFIKPHAELTPIIISKETGYAATTDTTDKIWSYVSKNAKPLKKSPYEKVIYTNSTGTEEVCSLCWNESDILKKVITIYPPKVLAFLRTKGEVNYEPIPHKYGCSSIGDKKNIEIIYPKEDSLILIPRNFEKKYEKVKLKAATGYRDAVVYWYLDKNYITKTENIHEIIVDFENGNHNLYITDNLGNSTSVNFKSDKK
jgi:penicillin-binding protein 1C